MAEPTVTELSKQLADTQQLVLSGQTALNITWTLLTGFLVMFMQAGFALVETGLTRAKNVAHTMGMNFLVYSIGILGFWALGFGLQMGGVGALSTFGNDATLSGEFIVHIAGQGLRPVRHEGLLPDARGLHVAGRGAVPVPDGVHGHDGDDSDRRDGGALAVLVVRHLQLRDRVDHLPDLRELGLGRRLAVAARPELRARPRPRRLRGQLGRAPGRRRRGAGRGEGARAAHRQVRAPTARRGRSRGTTSRWRCSGRSSSRSAGSASTPARRCRGWTRARRSSP